MDLLFENTNTAADIIPIEKSKKEPVFTKTIKPSTTKANGNKPNLSLDIQHPF
jgi:hypothetical protein